MNEENKEVKMTFFSVTQTTLTACSDCHTIEEFAMSHFGTEQLPKHVKVEIVADPNAKAKVKEDAKAAKPAA